MDQIAHWNELSSKRTRILNDNKTYVTMARDNNSKVENNSSNVNKVNNNNPLDVGKTEQNSVRE